MNAIAADPVFEIRIPSPEIPKGEREYRAFLRLLPGLLATHEGRFVAIHEGAVVDDDASDLELVKRVHARVGYVPIHVGLVTEERQLARMPRYREVRPQG